MITKASIRSSSSLEYNVPSSIIFTVDKMDCPPIAWVDRRRPDALAAGFEPGIGRRCEGGACQYECVSRLPAGCGRIQQQQSGGYYKTAEFHNSQDKKCPTAIPAGHSGFTMSIARTHLFLHLGIVSRSVGDDRILQIERFRFRIVAYSPFRPYWSGSMNNCRNTPPYRPYCPLLS